MTDVRTFYFYCMDGDYTPQAFGTADKLIAEGDNIHDGGLRHYAEGYAVALNARLNIVEIDTDEDLAEHAKELTKYGVYDDFKEIL